jgi:hypothetical protein
MHYRNMRTTAEHRATELSPVRVRAKRNLANLPTAWDDKPHGRRGRCDRAKNHRRP